MDDRLITGLAATTIVCGLLLAALYTWFKARETRQKANALYREAHDLRVSAEAWDIQACKIAAETTRSIQVLGCSQSMWPYRDIAQPQMALELAKANLTKQLTREVEKYIEFRSVEDPYTGDKIMKAELLVVEEKGEL